MLINVKRSTGELLAANGASFYGQTRAADAVPVRSSVPVAVCFYDDNGYPCLLNPATGTLTFAGQPAAGDTFTIGTTVYTAVTTLSGAANEVFLGANLAGFVANLVGAVNASTTAPEAAGTTYGTGTLANALVFAAAQGSAAIALTARYADGSGNALATSTTSTRASFGGATLAGADVLRLDIKPTGEYDANFTLATPTFAAPLDPTTGYYTGTLTSNTVQGNGLLSPNNPAVGTLTFTAQPAANSAVTLGTLTYPFATVLSGAAGEVLLGATLAGTVANLLGAINALSGGGQAAGTTYGAGTAANPLATAAPGVGTALAAKATAAALGVAVASTSTATAAAWSNATLLAGVSTATEPDSVPLMSQLSWGPVGVTLPGRTPRWTLNLTNAIRHGGEGAPTDANQSYTSAQVLTGLAQAAAAEPGLGAPVSDYSLLVSLANKTRAWLATSALGRTLLGVADAATARAALGAVQDLVPTAVKSAAYPAAPGDDVLVDTSAGAVPVTLPTAPADRTRVGVKIVKGAIAAPVMCGAGDVLVAPGGPTSATVSVLNQKLTFSYNVATKVWGVTDSLALSQLDARFATAAQGTKADASALTIGVQMPSAPLEGVSIVGYGNSYLAAVPPITGQGYLGRLKGRIQSRLFFNYGINGGFAQDCARAAYSSFPVSTPYASSTAISFGSPWYGLVVLDPTRNDAGYDGQTSSGGTTAKSRAGFRYGLDFLIRLARSSSIIDERAANFVYAGTWTQSAGNTFHSNTLIATTVPGASCTITTPVGTDFDLVTYSLDDSFVGGSAACAPYSITVDGVAFRTGTTDGLYRYVGSNPTYAGVGAGNAGIVAIPLRGLSNQAHTVVITHTGTSGQFLYLDGLLVASPTPPTIVIPKAAYLAPAGYAAYGGGGGAGAGMATDDVYNGIIDAVVGQFPSDGSIVTWNPNTAGFVPATMMHSDGIHPNDPGMRFYADGLMGLLNALPYRAGMNVF